MEFYTSVHPLGDKMLVRGYSNGKRYQRKVDFNPTLYVVNRKQDDMPSKWRTLDGDKVYEIKPGSIRETKDFIKRYDSVEGFPIYGNTNYAYQYISDMYPSDINWDMEQIKVYTIDIETATENGFPDLKSANEEILLITLKDLHTKKVITFGTKPYNSKRDVNDAKYIYCSDEQQLLKEFIIYWQQNYPDVITGWNTDFFDMPYLIRRLGRELGESFAEKISPWNYINERKIFIKGNEEISYDILGISQLDYLELYKKYTYTKQESYRLDYIAESELGDKKKENPGVDFKDFYTNYWNQFVEYNIHDVELVDRLEDKMRLIELHLTMAYNAKINHEDVYSQVRMWDTIIYNHLRKKGIVIPQKSSSGKDAQFEGAYVKDPIIGQHKWVASFDLNSLYPHLIMQYNISPETLTSEKMSVTVDKLLEKQIDTSYLKRRDLCLTANGWTYKRDVKGFMSELMETMYANRSKFKKQMLKIQQEYEKDKSQKQLLKEISRLTNLQMAMKIALNSAYGAMGNQYFRYFDIRMAEGITLSGQLSIRWMANKLNAFLNKTLKTQDKDFIIAIDTDSIYLNLGDLVEKVAGDKDTDGKIKFMDKICEEVFQPFIDQGYQELSDYMNAFAQKMQMKREVLADKAIWTAKKRYIINVHNSEGVQYAKPKPKVMGLEMVKSSTPAVIRDKLKDSLEVILHGTEKDLHKYVLDFKNEFVKMPVEDIAFPRSCNGLKQYAGSPIYIKGTPIQVRGALLYNHHCKRLGLDKKYQPIRDGDKIKFVYLRTPNPFQEDVIAFSQHLPNEFGLEAYIDYDTQFEKVFLDPLQIVIESLNWKTEEQVSLEDFFG
jgi:DNA polymerase elongation subunit (family B)